MCWRCFWLSAGDRINPYPHLGYGYRPGVDQAAFVIAKLNLGQLGDVQTDVQNLPVDPTRFPVNLLISLRRDGWWCFYKGMNPAPGHHLIYLNNPKSLKYISKSIRVYFGGVQIGEQISFLYSAA